MDAFRLIFLILSAFVFDSCRAQVKNASLPLVMWHGMGMHAIRCVLLCTKHAFNAEVAFISIIIG